MYIPPNITDYSKLDDSNYRMRLAIQGPPGSGKTWAVCRTFPNVHVLDFDNKLQAHIGQPITSSPFYNPDFCAEVENSAKRKVGYVTADKSIPNIKNAVIGWTKTVAPLFEPEQTLFYDSWTMIMNNVMLQDLAAPNITAKGEVDTRKYYKELGDYAITLLSLFKNLRCRVVVAFHETMERDKDGNPTSKWKPLMDGRVGDQLAQHFTDRFRQTAKEVNGLTKYFWQVRPNNQCDSGTVVKKLLAMDPKITQIEADYKNLV